MTTKAKTKKTKPDSRIEAVPTSWALLYESKGGDYLLQVDLMSRRWALKSRGETLSQGQWEHEDYVLDKAKARSLLKSLVSTLPRTPEHRIPAEI